MRSRGSKGMTMKRQQPETSPQDSPWRQIFEQEMEEVTNNPNLSDEEKAGLVRQIYLPDEEWEPIEFAGEPISETIIKMRGERQ
jgi:hypothetical protein